MSAIGRNQPCQCGSKKKTKHCCGVPHGPSETELAKAFLATEARQSARRLIRLSEDEIHELYDEMLDLPERHLSSSSPFPSCCHPSWKLSATPSTTTTPTPLTTISSRPSNAWTTLDSGRISPGLCSPWPTTDVIDRAVADAAIVDLDSHGSSALMRTSLLHALSVSVGASRTPAGLLVVSR